MIAPGKVATFCLSRELIIKSDRNEKGRSF